MREACGEKAIRRRVAWVVLYRKEQLRNGLIKAPAQEMSTAYCSGQRNESRAWTEPLACPISENAIDMPATRVIRVQRERTINQRYRRVNVLAEVGQCVSGTDQDARIIVGHFQGSPGEIDALQTVRRRIFTPALDNQPKTANRTIAECWPIPRIERDRLLEETERFLVFAAPTTRSSHRPAGRGRRR